MALQKTIVHDHLIAQDAYHKITALEYVTDYIEEGVKKYSITLKVGSYIDNTKDKHLKTDEYHYRGIVQSKLTYKNLYLLGVTQ